MLKVNGVIYFQASNHLLSDKEAINYAIYRENGITIALSCLMFFLDSVPSKTPKQTTMFKNT
ncbi:MAG: hypothetical protein WC167_03460 [Bacilli bacterium]